MQNSDKGYQIYSIQTLVNFDVNDIQNIHIGTNLMKT